MALYREGKAAMAADGTVTGTGTKWQSSLSLIRPGATIMFLSSPIQMAVVNKVVSDTEIKAITTKGAVVASSDYAILLSDSITVDGLAQDVAETLRYYQSQETVIADALEFFKTFDFESLQNLANQVKADSQSAGTSAAAAAASESKAKTSETNAKASETAANSANTDAQTAKGQTQSLYNQTVDLVSGVQAPDKLTASPGGSRAWMKIATVKDAGLSYCFAQFIIGGGGVFGETNVPVDIFSISGRALPGTLTSNNIDANFTQCALIAALNSTSRLRLGVVKNTDGSFDVYLYSPAGYIPNLWLNRVNIQAGNSYITGPIIDRAGYTWITTEPAGIVYNSPSDYLMANDRTIPRTNVANTFSQPQSINVPGGNATLTLNGCVVRANNSDVLVLSTPSGSEGMVFRPKGDTSTNGQMTISGNGDVLVNGAVRSNGDLWIVPNGAMHSDLGLVRSFETLNAAVPKFNAPTNQDGRGLKIVSSNGVPEINMIAPRGSNTSSPAVRAMWCDGSLGNSDKYIGAVQAWSTFFFGASGHDGEKFDSMRGAVNIQATEGWWKTSTPTRILFETCTTGSVVRTARWCVDHNGNFIPMGDGGYDIGWGSGRVRNIYATNGSINTSDARMKNDVRAMSDPETEAAKAIAKEIGLWTWKEQADMNDVREHCGLTVQRAMEIMESFGLEPFKYGFICYDKWDEQTVVSEYGPANEDGSENPIYKTIPAGDRYSFRLDELNMFIAKGFEARLSALEDKLGM